MKSRGGTSRAGDVIPYIFCLGEDGQAAGKTAQADKARHPDEIRKLGSGLQVGAYFEVSLYCVSVTPLFRLRILSVTAGFATDRTIMRAH